MADTIDPRALRALAHPIRWQLIDILDHEGTATVTRCSEVLGQSTATCSYHLGILAKYGFVVRAADRGRERPWRLASQDQQAVKPSEAAGEVDEAGLADEAGLVDETGLADEAERSTKILGTTAWLTPHEARQMVSDVRQTLDRYAGRGREVASRPDDAREVRIFASISLAQP